MSKRENIKTTPKQIVEYWESKVNEMDITVDWCEADKRCWRCGIETNLQRAHIIPDSLGGEDKPFNFVLLCERCHAEAPNVTDPDIMWDWLKAYKIHSLATLGVLLAYKEYKFIYNSDFWDDLEYIINGAQQSNVFDPAEIRKQAFFVANDGSTHFGQPNFNTSTLAGMMRMYLTELAVQHNIDFPTKETVAEKPRLRFF